MKTQILGIESTSHQTRHGRVNGRLVLILAVALLVSGTVIHLVHGVMVDRNASDLYDRAVRLLDEAKADETAAQSAEGEKLEKLEKQVTQKRRDAIRYLGQYLQLETDDHEAWLLYAKSSDEFQTAPRSRRKVHERINAALRKLESAIEAGTATDDVAEQYQALRRRSIKVAMNVGALTRELSLFKIAAQDIDELNDELNNDENSENDNDAELKLWSGICAAQLQEWKQAASAFDEAIALDPSLVEAYKNLILVIRDHTRDVPFQGYDPSGRTGVTVDEVITRLGEKMVANGKPAYQAYFTRAVLEQESSETADNDEIRDADLKQAREDIEKSVKQLETLIAQPEQSIDKTIDSPAKEIEPFLVASRIYSTSARYANEHSDAETAKKFREKAHLFAATVLDRQPSNLTSYLLLSKNEQSTQFAKPTAEQDLSAPIQYLKDGLAQIPEGQRLATTEELRLRLELVEQMILAKYWEEGPDSAGKNQELQDAFISLTERNAPGSRVDFLHALQLFEQHDWNKAIPALVEAREQLLEEDLLSLRINMMLATAYGQTGNSQLQLRALERAKELSPLMIAVRVRLASALARAGRTDEAIEDLNLTKISVDGVASQIARLTIQQMQRNPVQRRKWNEVRDRLTQVLDLLDKSGRKFSPDWTTVKTALAHTYKNHATELNDTKPKQAKLALDESETLLREAIEQQPDEPTYWTELASVQFLRGSLEKDGKDKRSTQAEALKLLDEADAIFGPLPVLLTTRANAIALLHADDENTTDAIEQINALGDDLGDLNDEEKIQLWRGLGMANLSLGSIKNARRYWQQIVDTKPFNLEYQLFLLQLVLTDSKFLLSNVKPDLPADKLAELRKQHEALREEATHIAAEIRKIEGDGGPNGDFAEANALLLEIEFQQRQLATQQMTVTDEKLIAQLQRARKLLLAAKSKQPRDTEIPAVLGRVELSLGNEQAAIDNLLIAVDLGDYNSIVLDQLIPLLSKYNRNDEIRSIVNRVQIRTPEVLTPGNGSGFGNRLGAYAAQASVQLGDYADAVDLLKKISPDPENNANYHLRVGQIKLMEARSKKRVDKETEIEPHFRDAIKIAPLDPKARLALVAYLLEANRREDAVQEVEKAKTDLGSDDNHALLARMYRAVGNLDVATSEYEEALSKRPTDSILLGEMVDYYVSLKNAEAAEQAVNAALSIDEKNPSLFSVAANLYAKTGQREKALIYLKKILDRKSEFDEPFIKSARRRKALLLGTTNVYQESLNAVKLIDENLVESHDLRDLRVKMEILNRHATQDAQKQVIEILNEIDAAGQLNLQERFILAKLYQMRGNWDAAKGQLLNLVDAAPNSQKYLAEYIDGLINQNQQRDAAPFITRLEQIAPDSIALAMIKSRIEMADDDPEAAVRELTQFLDNHPPPKYDLDLAMRIGTLYKADPQPTEELLDVFEEFVKSTDDRQAPEVLKNARELYKDQKSAEAARLAAAFTGKVVARGDLFAEETLVIAKILETLAGEEISATNEAVITKAEEIYRDYVQLSRKPTAKFALASFYGRQKRISEALEICDQLDDGSIPVAQMIALKVALLRTGFATPEEVRRVSQSVDQAVQQNPNSIPLKLQLATLRDYQELDSEAIDAYDSILEKDPKNVLANNNLAWLLAMSTGNEKNTAKALNLINEAIAVRGPVPEFLDTRATIHMIQGDAAAAIADLEIAVKSTSNNNSMYYHLAQAYLLAGDFSEAKRTMQRARKQGFTPHDLHPREIEAHDQLVHDLGLDVEKK
ncbi:tetratricopeptide repeat protein [Symmachiella macrocystis]|uniref:Tetratricopeptide repeat protein n=1 Tax=Symmachiella macrocystis TaxID=2527985 RepID=A0A5C6BKI2_9PLAN|nr:tetratricopeptide repeat protein [Symmachiella macrocystis]TWU11856.1 tetratricopeptide repeat protein [Symmachiella macrocystis]